jgi:hypothetical protein
MHSPIRSSNNPNTINLKNLRRFDKATGGFRDKNFTEEFSVNKTEQYLSRSPNRLGGRDASKSPVAGRPTPNFTAKSSKVKSVAPKLLKPLKQSSTEFQNEYL